MKFPEVDKNHFQAPHQDAPTGPGETAWLTRDGVEAENEALRQRIESLQAEVESKERAIQSREAKATEYANEINSLREQLMANTVPAVTDQPPTE